MTSADGSQLTESLGALSRSQPVPSRKDEDRLCALASASMARFKRVYDFGTGRGQSFGIARRPRAVKADRDKDMNVAA